jgi:hypothetical protein
MAPGASLQAADGDEAKRKVKVKGKGTTNRRVGGADDFPGMD